MFGISNIYLLIFTVVAAAVGSVLNGTFPKKYKLTPYSTWIFTFTKSLFCLVCATVLYIINGSSFKVSLFSFLLAIWLAICCSFSIFALAKAYSAGPVTYTSIIISLSAIIPTFSGKLFFGENINLIQYIGVLLMCVCIVLSIDTKNSKSNKKANLTWAIYCALGFVLSGSVGVIQKIHQNSEAHRAEMPVLIITAFVFSTTISGIGLFMQRKFRRYDQNYLSCNKAVFYSFPIFAGICWGINHVINLPLAREIPSVIFFPVVNLSPTIILAIFMFLVLKERMSAKQWIGLATGFISIILLSGIIKI